ncbi:hypothetical protein CesoFtcFv8_007507 [Champsocephalus esox]|uniref:Uncharacterized protein n=2 Tax=Champsocephalus TaxID=52236 RepID=A0AAN8DSS5_CHAGU|nr:hypothetical protein CesoFtcFv8_007507 [Champsocephalus esox]KAK5928007.1 hypothetical protein CgunFtcFv8_013108 [Champsocephalus gunnari]
MPTNTSRDRRRDLIYNESSMWNETGSKRKDKAIQILDEEPGVLLLNLNTSCLQAGWRPVHHATHQTSCHPWHHLTTWCAITAGMFPELVFHICVAT